MHTQQLTSLIDQLQTICFGDLTDIQSTQFLFIEKQLQHYYTVSSPHPDYYLACALVSFCHLRLDECDDLLASIKRENITQTYRYLFDMLQLSIDMRKAIPDIQTTYSVFSRYQLWQITAPIEYHIIVLSQFISSLRGYNEFSQLFDQIIIEIATKADKLDHIASAAGFYYYATIAIHFNIPIQDKMNMLLKALERARYYECINFEAGIIMSIAYLYEGGQLISETYRYYKQIIDNPEFDQINQTSRSLALLNFILIAIKTNDSASAAPYFKQLWPIIEHSNRKTSLSLIAHMLELSMECDETDISFQHAHERFCQIVKTYTNLGNQFHITRIETDLLLLEAKIYSLLTTDTQTMALHQLRCYFGYLTYTHTLSIDYTYDSAQIHKKIARCFQMLDDSYQSLYYFRLYEEKMNAWMKQQRKTLIHKLHKQFESLLQKEKIKTLKTDNKCLETKYHHDSLTGLYSRHFLNQLLSNKIKIFGYILIDADHFKLYNDTFGHIQGDHILKQLGSLIKEALIEHEYAFRFGGEEFLIICCHPNSNRIKQLTQHIHSSLKQQAIPFHTSTNKQLTISIGCFLDQLARYAFEDAFSEVDTLLYKAKSAGRNTIVFSE